MGKYNLKEILTTASTSGGNLIPSYLYDTVFESVRDELVCRPKAAMVITTIPGSSVDIDTTDRNSISVQEVAEGAEIPIDVQAYSTFNLKPKKYAVRPLITKEMIEDSKYDVIDLNLREAGYQMARNEDNIVFATLTTGAAAASHTITGSTAITIANITEAISDLEIDGYKADTMYVSPQIACDIRNIDTFVEADKLGSTEMREKGFIGKIYGMSVIENAHVSQSTTYDCYIIDSRYAFVIAEKRPVTIENYDDKTRDMSGIVVTQRINTRYLFKEAIAHITTT
jgi:HK97 family phage major capsid protein